MAAAGGRIRGLDGLRAVAVGLVIVYHLVPHQLPGGFIGVDVFFVISGFLITTLLLREVRQNGYMNMPVFWLRRLRRLLPALLLLLLVCTALVLVVDTTRGGDLRVGLARQVLGGLTFSTNWVEIAHGTDYFDQNQPVLYKPLWSLAVEEQFYLLWPPALALLIALTSRWRARIWVVSAVGVLSALWMAVLHLSGEDVTRPYYGTDSHLFGLMAGVVIAFLWMSRRSVLRSGPWMRWRGLAAGLSLAGVLLLALVMPEDGAVTYRGGLFVASLLMAVLIAAIVPGPTPLHRVLELRPMEWVGERSYGLYLWHWPVLLLLSAALPAQAEASAGQWLLRGLALLVTVVAAAASYRWVEVPVRRHGFRACAIRGLEAVRAPGTRGPRGALSRPRVLAGAGALCLLLGLVAVATAPEKTEVQRTIEANEAALQEMQTLPADPGAEGATAPGGGSTGSSGGGGRGGASQEPTGEPSSPSPAPSPSASDEASPSASGRASASASGAPSASGSPRGAAWYVPTGDQLSVFGDSLVVTSLQGFQGTFPGAAVDARSNRQWPEGQAVVRAHLRAGDVRDSVVLSFGTNAGIGDRDVVRETLDMLGPERQVVMVNLYGKSSWIEDANEALEEIAADYPNVTVADWHSVARSNPGLLQSDGVHPGLEGGRVYADLVRDAFAERAGE